MCFFFFQAEDGIRDWSVTGVQRVLFRSVHSILEAKVGEFFERSNALRTLFRGQSAEFTERLLYLLSFGLGKRLKHPILFTLVQAKHLVETGQKLLFLVISKVLPQFQALLNLLNTLA